jgi:hypothetical protein
MINKCGSCDTYWCTKCNTSGLCPDFGDGNSYGHHSQRWIPLTKNWVDPSERYGKQQSIEARRWQSKQESSSTSESSSSSTPDDGAGAYGGIAILVAFYSVYTYGWVKGIIIALAWPLILIYYIFSLGGFTEKQQAGSAFSFF